MNTTLRLTLTDAAGQDLNDHVLVDIFSTTSSEHLQTSAAVKRELVVSGMNPQPVKLYRIVVAPANHRTVQFFIRLSDGEESSFGIAVPVEPSKVVSIQALPFQQLPLKAQNVMNTAACPTFVQPGGAFVSGSKLYDVLQDYPLLKACFLNIVAKSAATPLLGGGTCLDEYGSLLRIAQDRLFLQTTRKLVDSAAHSPLFHPVSAELHHPLPGYRLVSSFKTFDHYGNLQLTFQCNAGSADDYVVDVDIDDAQGIEHLFQVLRNAVTGPTNPYVIRDILLQQQPKVDAGYTFVFPAAASAGNTA